MNRRQALKSVGTVGAALLLPQSRAAQPDFEITITPVTPRTIRISVLPLRDGKPAEIPLDGSLQPAHWGEPSARLRRDSRKQTIKSGSLLVSASPDPIEFAIATNKREPIQQLNFDGAALTFATANTPLFGLGEGGPQFDRRGSTDRMRSGQGGYQLRTHGGRVPIPWLIGIVPGGVNWAMFLHQPAGTFDFTGPSSRFQLAAAGDPLDLFFIASREPSEIMAEYARLT